MMRHQTTKRNPSLTKIPSTTVRNVTVALLTKTIARGFITVKMADLASDHAKGGNIMTVTDEIVTMRLTVDLGNQNQVNKSIFFLSLIINILFHARITTVTDNLQHIHTANRNYNPGISECRIVFDYENLGITLSQNVQDC